MTNDELQMDDKQSSSPAKEALSYTTGKVVPDERQMMNKQSRKIRVNPPDPRHPWPPIPVLRL